MIEIKPVKLSGMVPRMLELTSRLTRWHRRDWRAGTLELVDETLEEALIPGTREEALKAMRSYLQEAVGRDPAVAPKQKQIIQALESINPLNGEASYAAQLAKRLSDEIRKTYLLQWAEIFDDPGKAGKLDVEGSAKRIISHVLYLGIPAASVYRLIKERQEATEPFSFSDVLRELDQRIQSPTKAFTFAVPVNGGPSFLHSRPYPENWLDAQELKEWKNRYAPEEKSMRHYGGFLLSVSARDVNEAADEVRALLPQLAFKFEADSKHSFSIMPKMWSQEKGTAFSTRRYAEELKLRAFRRADMLHGLDMAPPVRNMLAILEPLKTVNSHVVVVNGWVAIESLLVGPEETDRVGAERMARIVAASYFRTELSWLAGNYRNKYQSDDAIVAKVADATNSLERSHAMAVAILDECNTSLLDHPDQIAVEKMQDALLNQKRVFERTVSILQREFLRMYRKRNLIVHSGRVLDHGTDSLAEKVRPLLMAGIDQILIAQLQHNMGAQELAASIEYKARNLSEDAREAGTKLWNLLEPESEVV